MVTYWLKGEKREAVAKRSGADVSDVPKRTQWAPLEGKVLNSIYLDEGLVGPDTPLLNISPPSTGREA